MKARRNLKAQKKAIFTADRAINQVSQILSQLITLQCDIDTVAPSRTVQRLNAVDNKLVKLNNLLSDTYWHVRDIREAI